MPNVTIPVPAGIVGHGRTYDAVVLRPPTFGEYLDIGEVLEWVVFPNGMRIPTHNNETVRRYLEKCLVSPKDVILIEQGGMKLAQELKAAIVGFFQSESREDDSSRTSDATSSGAAGRDASAPAT